jgi:hypothetical protein
MAVRERLLELHVLAQRKMPVVTEDTFLVKNLPLPRLDTQTRYASAQKTIKEGGLVFFDMSELASDFRVAAFVHSKVKGKGCYLSRLTIPKDEIRWIPKMLFLCSCKAQTLCEDLISLLLVWLLFVSFPEKKPKWAAISKTLPSEKKLSKKNRESAFLLSRMTNCQEFLEKLHLGPASRGVKTPRIFFWLRRNR